MYKLIALVFLLLATPLAADTQTEIKTALDYFAQIWNENDLEAIQGYYHPDFVLVSDSGVLTRAQQIDGIRNLVSEGGDRGVLSYDTLTVKKLDDAHAMAYGHLKLTFEDKSVLDSWFTTVFEKTPFGWKALLTRN